MRVGVTLPTFRDDTAAVEAAVGAEALDLDGVFVFDHLWPMGRRDRPALSAFPVLGAVAAVTSRVCVGPLVARVGLVPDDVLVAELRSLAHMAPGRLIAGLGTGDAKSSAENEAYGIPTGPPDERRLAVRTCARRLVDQGVPVWIGGGSSPTTELAVDIGPGAAVNLWAAPSARIAELAARCEVTWGGPAPSEVPALTSWLCELAEAGATWAVCAWPESLDAVAEAARTLRGA